jgi:hypothetical protein
MSIFSKIIKIANSVDTFITRGAITRSLINSQIKEYGEVIDLKIDNQAKTISLSVLLKGENSPINVKIEEYELKQDSGKSKITVKSANAERAWLNAALQNFVVGKSFKVPKNIEDYVNDLLA